MEKNMKYILIGIVVIIIVVTAAYFIETNKTFSKGKVVASVNGHTIYQKDLQLIEDSVSQQTNKKQTINDSVALNSIIGEELLLQDAEGGGYNLTNAQVEEMIDQQLKLAGSNITELQQQAKAKGTNFDDLIDGYRKQIMIKRITGDILSKVNVSVTEQEKIQFYNDNKDQAIARGNNVSSYENLSLQIGQYLLIQKQQRILADYINGLKQNASIQIFD